MNDTGEIFDYTQLVDEIKKAGQTRQSASAILEALVKDNDDLSNNTPQNDDVTLFVLKVNLIKIHLPAESETVTCS